MITIHQNTSMEASELLKPFGLPVADVTGLSSDKTFRKNLRDKEVVLMSRQLTKINKRNREQQRLIMITTHAVYNISGKTQKRRIELPLIYAVTVSRRSSEFVLHIPTEYDYRFSTEKSPETRDLFLLYLVVAMRINCQQSLKFYFIDHEMLEPFTLQEQQSTLEKGMQLQPKIIPTILTALTFQLLYINNTYCNAQTQILFVRNPQHLRIRLYEDFSKQLGLQQGSLCKTSLVTWKTGQSQQLLVLKTIDKQNLDIDMDYLELLLSNYKPHPFIEQLELAFQHQNKVLLFFQLKKGGDLYQHLRQVGTFTEQTAKYIICQVALALCTLHQEGITYGDLKPENILIDEQGYVSLTDFGYGKLRIYRLFRKQDKMNFTPEYCPPEYLKMNELTRMSDWYQLGALLYEMLVGIPLFYHQTSPEVALELSLTEQLHLPRDIDISYQCVNFMAELLISDSAKRLGFKLDFMEVMAHDWLKQIDIEGIKNRKIDLPYKPKLDDQQVSPLYFTMEQLQEDERQW